MLPPPNASVINATANADAIALEAIANMRFISFSTQAINNAAAQGLFYVVLTTFDNCNLTNLINYYHGLGYQVILPDVHNINGYDETPYQLYGVDYYQWLTNSFNIFQLQNPTRFRISWNIPFNPIVPPVLSTQTANYTMSQNNETVWADTSGGSFIVSLPATPSDGWVETITKPSAANTLTISGNGNNINGSSNPITLTTANSSAALIFFTASGWNVFPT